MTTVFIVVLLVLSLAVGLYLYFHSGPDGGRDPGMRSDEYARLRLERRLEEHHTIEKAEARFQAEHPDPPERGR